jgi:hypothetical protein
MGGQVDERTLVNLLATTATFRASTPCFPISDLAVDRAEFSVALLPLVKVWALRSTVLMMGEDVTLAFLLAATARDGTCGPGAEL